MDPMWAGVIGTVSGALIGAAASLLALWLHYRTRHDRHREQLYERQLDAAEALVRAMTGYVRSTVQAPHMLFIEGDAEKLRVHIREDYFRLSGDYIVELSQFLLLLPTECANRTVDLHGAIDTFDTKLRKYAKTGCGKGGLQEDLVEAHAEAFCALLDATDAVRASLCIEQLSGNLKGILGQLRTHSRVDKLATTEE